MGQLVQQRDLRSGHGPALGLEIHRWDGATGRAAVDAAGDPVVLGTFHPTFLYESLFLLVLAVALLVLDRRLRLAPGQVMALYIAGYPVGRFFIELLRTDAANTILGLRVNIWTSLAVFVLGVVLYIVLGRRARSGEEKTSQTVRRCLSVGKTGAVTLPLTVAVDVRGCPLKQVPRRPGPGVTGTCPNLCTRGR